MSQDFNNGIPAGDWTSGVAAIHYQDCSNCGMTWYFYRPFCPGCGIKSRDFHIASGNGTVYAITIVNRAPSAELTEYAPYGIVLVDASEGFRLMAHGEASLQIGDPVKVSFKPFGKSLIPYFTRATS